MQFDVYEEEERNNAPVPPFWSHLTFPLPGADDDSGDRPNASSPAMIICWRWTGWANVLEIETAVSEGDSENSSGDGKDLSFPQINQSTGGPTPAAQ